MSDTLPNADPLALLQHRAWVRLLARRLLADENAVDDVEQDTWAAALRAGPDEPRALRTWLGRVASRFALQRLRGESRRARREAAVGAGGDEAARSAADVVAEADAHGNVVQAVLALDEPYRTTILLRYFDGLAIADVAARMDVPVETARTRLRRAHEQLQARLEREHGKSALALLGPLAAAAGPAPAPGGLGLTAALGGSALVVAAIVGIVALGGWTLGRLTAPGASGATGAMLPQQVPPPAPPGPADPAQAPPPEAPVDERCVVRDLWDGKPVGGLQLHIRRVGSDGKAFFFAVTTDADGHFDENRVKLRDTDAFLIPANDGVPRWSPGVAKKSDVTVPREIWVARMVTVRGRVRPASADDPWIPERALVHVDLTPAATDATRVASGLPNLDAAFLREHLIERTVVTGTPPSGQFDLEVPLVAGAIVRVSAPGRIAQVKPLADGIEYEFALQPLLHLRGRVLQPTGLPIVRPEIRVVATATARDGSAPAPVGDEKPAVTRLEGGVLAFEVGVEPTAFDRFDFGVSDTWNLTLDLRQRGFRRVVREVGQVTKDAELDLRAEPSGDADLRTIRIGGAPSPASRLAVVERWGALPVEFTVPVDTDGRFDASWFLAGRDYELSLWAPLGADARPATALNAPRIVRWTGADLDWDTLPLLDTKTPGAGK